MVLEQGLEKKFDYDDVRILRRIDRLLEGRFDKDEEKLRPVNFFFFQMTNFIFGIQMVF